MHGLWMLHVHTDLVDVNWYDRMVINRSRPVSPNQHLKLLAVLGPKLC